MTERTNIILLLQNALILAKLEWNQNEMTWDCPCHGSRFDYHGNLINNPAMRMLSIPVLEEE